MSAAYWTGWAASSWGTSWGDSVIVAERIDRSAGPLGGRRRGGKWQDLAEVTRIRKHDTEDDDLLLAMA